MTHSLAIPLDVITVLKDAESCLSECLQYENVSDKLRDHGEEILRGFRVLRNRYPLEFQQRGCDGGSGTLELENYEDNQITNVGTALASDEVSFTSDFMEYESRAIQKHEQVLKQGYLEKRNRDHGFFVSEWQKRWCVLTNISFCYYSSEKAKVSRGGFHIHNCSAHLAPNIRKDSRRDSCFELVSPGNRSYEFTATSPAEARDWVDEIQFLVRDIVSSSIPYDDEESYDDVDDLTSSPILHSPHRTISPLEGDDIYEVVPDHEEDEDSIELNGTNDAIKSGQSLINYADYYQGLWNCKSDKSDELSFQRGDIIHILSKEYNAYGWWVGELDGVIGIVPKAYLQFAYDLP